MKGNSLLKEIKRSCKIEIERVRKTLSLEEELEAGDHNNDCYPSSPADWNEAKKKNALLKGYINVDLGVCKPKLIEQNVSVCSCALFKKDLIIFGGLQFIFLAKLDYGVLTRLKNNILLKSVILKQTPILTI